MPGVALGSSHSSFNMGVNQIKCQGVIFFIFSKHIKLSVSGLRFRIM